MSYQSQNSTLKLTLLLVLGFLAIACDSEEEAVGTGSLTILLEAEDVILEGLEPGEDVENIRDGWGVSFDKYLVAVGNIDAHLSTDESKEVKSSDSYVVDLTQVPATGLELWSFDGLAEGRWEFNYATVGAGDGALKHDTVEEADFDEMVSNDWTYWISGGLNKAEGQSCPPAALATPGDQMPNENMSGDNLCYDAPEVKFAFGISAETNFGPCEIDGVTGFAITDGGAQTVAATVHGDHLFFNGFPEGDEGGVRRLAQWLADCDLDLDGVVTQAELEMISPSQLPEIDDRYQLGGSPISPIDNMYMYLMAQLKTQGHYQGEGECPVDGVAHDHGHGDHDDHDDHGDHDDHEGEDHDDHDDHEGEDHDDHDDHDDHEGEDHDDHEGEDHDDHEGEDHEGEDHDDHEGHDHD